MFMQIRLFHRSLNLGLMLVLTLLLSACERTEQPLSKAKHATIATYDADISDDGKFSLVATVNAGAGYWDLENNVLLYNWYHTNSQADDQQPSSEEIIAVDISSDGLWAVTASHKTMAVWSTTSGKNLGFYALPESDLRDIAIANEARALVLGLGDGKVTHINLTNGRRLEFMAHTEAINSLAISPNGRYVLSGSNDFKGIFWDSKTGMPLQTFEHDSRVILVALASDASYAFTSGNKADAFIWDLKSGQKISQLNLKERQYVLSTAKFASDSQTLLTGAPSKQLTLWQVATGQVLRKVTVSTRTEKRPSGAIVYAVGFAANGDLLSESSAGLGERWPLKKPKIK